MNLHMKKLQLKRGVVLLDDEMYAVVSQFRWYINTINGHQYVVRNDDIDLFHKRKILLHRLVMEYHHKSLPPRKPIRFVNGNSLDCRIANLKLRGDISRENK